MTKTSIILNKNLVQKPRLKSLQIPATFILKLLTCAGNNINSKFVKHFEFKLVYPYD